MRVPFSVTPIALAIVLAGCANAPASRPEPVTAAAAKPVDPSPAEHRAPVTILVSIDGFRADYLDRGKTPVLSRLATQGVRAVMHPSFPSKTFPNHWALVTGKVPDHNGIVGNTMRDPARPGETFTMASDDPFWWNEASPIWVDAEKAGIRTATMFWPGSNVAWGGTMDKKGHHAADGGTRPQDWQQFNGAVTGRQRVDAVLDWLRRPAATRPQFATLYFDQVDTAGHNYGPDAAETMEAVADVDRLVGMLVDGLTALDQPANLVIVADHGMAAVSSSRVVRLDQIAGKAGFEAIETGPYAAIYPKPGRDAALRKALARPQDHMQCWPKARIPARLRYGGNARVAPYLCLADVGWLIVDKPPREAKVGGAHGYDNAAPEMAALFIGSGPAIAPGGTLPPLDNVDVVPLLRDLLGMPQAPDGDGNDVFRQVLRR